MQGQRLFPSILSIRSFINLIFRQVVNEYFPEVEMIFDNQYPCLGPPFDVRTVAVDIKLEVAVCVIHSVVVMDIQHFLVERYAERGSVPRRTRHGKRAAQQFDVFIDDGEPDYIVIIENVARRGKLTKARERKSVG